MPHAVVKLHADRDAVRLQRLLERCSDYYELHEGWPTPADAGEYELNLDPTVVPKTANILVLALEGRDGALDGMVQILTDCPEPGIWWVGLLVVAPELRGHGKGSQLVQRALAAAAEAGIRTIQLAVSLKNPRGLKFWERAGFRDTEKRFSVTTRSGHVDDGLIMVRDLSDDLKPCFLALQSEEPLKNLSSLLIQLKKTGATQDEALQLFERFRAAVGCNRKDASEAEDRVDDIICDVMDFIVGWCRPEAHIFSANFDEPAFWTFYDSVRKRFPTWGQLK